MLKQTKKIIINNKYIQRYKPNGTYNVTNKLYFFFIFIFNDDNHDDNDDDDDDDDDVNDKNQQ